MSLDAGEWASWALFGDPAIRPPITLRELHSRVKEAAERHAITKRAAALEEAAKVADRFAREAAARGLMLGGNPMHAREIEDRKIGELVASNIAGEIRELTEQRSE